MLVVSQLLGSMLGAAGVPGVPGAVASGMKEKPKAELLDGSGKVVVSSMPVVKASAKSYKLRLTCKTTSRDFGVPSSLSVAESWTVTFP